MKKYIGKYKKEGLPGGPNEIETSMHGFIVTNEGQWKYPGQPTLIPSNEITMKGVNFPVLGIDDTGHSQMMMPGADYTFPGSMVYELPMAQDGKIIRNPGDPWEYTQDETGYYARKIGSSKWLKARGKALDAIEEKVYNVPVEQRTNYRNTQPVRPTQPTQPREQSGNGLTDQDIRNTIEQNYGSEIADEVLQDENIVEQLRNVQTPEDFFRNLRESINNEQQAPVEPTPAERPFVAPPEPPAFPEFRTLPRRNPSTQSPDNLPPQVTPGTNLPRAGSPLPETSNPESNRSAFDDFLADTFWSAARGYDNISNQISETSNDISEWFSEGVDDISSWASEGVDDLSNIVKSAPSAFDRLIGKYLPEEEGEELKAEDIALPTIEEEPDVEEYIPIQETYTELSQKPNDKGPGNLVEFYHTFDNTTGGTYRIGPKALELYDFSGSTPIKRENAQTVVPGQAVAHFLRDSDISENQQFHPESWKVKSGYEMQNMSNTNTIGYTKAQMEDKERYRTMYKKNEDGTYSVKYKKFGEINPDGEDAGWSYDLPVSRQHRFSDVLWDKKGDRTEYLASSWWIPLKKDAKLISSEKDTKHTSIVTKGSNVYSRFSGGSVALIFNDPKTGKKIGVDVTGSPQKIQEIGKKIAKDYSVSEDDIDVIYHDMGSYSAKPGSIDGNLDYGQWVNYNTYNRGFSGAPLILAVPGSESPQPQPQPTGLAQRKKGGPVNDDKIYLGKYTMVKKAQDGMEVPSWLNPMNWGVSDYSDKEDFNTAYSTARKEGETEFMWNNKRYNTDYKGTPAQQLKETGITNNRLGVKNSRSDKAYNYVKPSLYEKEEDVIQHMKNYFNSKDRFDNTEYNRLNKEYIEEGNKNEYDYEKLKELEKKMIPYSEIYHGEDDPYSEDGWNIYLGRPQTKNTFSISNYTPSGSKETNINYYSLPDPFKEELFNLYNENQIKEGLNSEFSFPSGFGEGSSRARVLGNFTVNEGEDERGSYISYYDIYDLNPNLPIVGKTFGLDNFVGEPFEIYDRIYTKNYDDGQKKRMYYSDKELSELDINKKDFDTLALQRELSNRGYNLSKSIKKDGTFDGILGEETIQALLDYQSKNKIKPKRKKTYATFQDGGVLPPDYELFREHPGGAPYAYDAPQVNGVLLPDPNRPNMQGTNATEYKVEWDGITMPSIVNGTNLGPQGALDRYLLTGEHYPETVDPGSYSRFYDTVYPLGLMKYGKGGLKQWFAEDWRDIKTGKKCGRGEDEKGRPYPACRPANRVNETTPKTVDEMSSSEKKKFRRAKRGSKRINYNHKRNNKNNK